MRGCLDRKGGVKKTEGYKNGAEIHFDHKLLVIKRQPIERISVWVIKMIEYKAVLGVLQKPHVKQM